MCIREFLLVCSLVFFAPEAGAQVKRILPPLQEEKQNVVETIALYPDSQRVLILQASAFPEILVRMQHIRSQTEGKFKELISGLSETDQERIYNMSRYPDLMKAICERGEKRTTAEMNSLLDLWPEEIRVDAAHVNSQHFDLLIDICDLHMAADLGFAAVLAGYPLPIREVYGQLTEIPEVVSLLTANLDVVVLLGEGYQHFPEELRLELDSLGILVAEEQAKELNEWKRALEGNPEAMREYESSAKEFAGEYGYDDDVYDEPVSERVTRDVVVHHIWRPYSYWFGWPSWYEYEIWYPNPWWYHWGYYYDPHHVIVIVGWPSEAFLHWHFNHHQHFYHYPHFTNHVVSHFYGPRRMGSRLQPVYRNWEQKHRSDLPNNWLNDDKNRVDRIREYGKFKLDYHEKVRVMREKSPTEREYLRDHADRYPGLKPVLQEKPEPVRTQPGPGRQYQPTEREKTPKYRPAEREKPRPQPETDRVKQEPPKRETSPQNPPAKREPKKTTPRKEPVKRE